MREDREVGWNVEGKDPGALLRGGVQSREDQGRVVRRLAEGGGGKRMGETDSSTREPRSCPKKRGERGGEGGEKRKPFREIIGEEGGSLQMGIEASEGENIGKEGRRRIS